VEEAVKNETVNVTDLPDFVPDNKEGIVDQEGIILEDEFLFATKVWAH